MGEMRRGSADSIRAGGHQVPHQQAGYKTAICLPVTPKSVLASREASIQELMVHHRDADRPRRRKIVGIVGIIATLCFIVGAFVVVDVRTKSYWTEHECEDHGVCPPTETPGEES